MKFHLNLGEKSKRYQCGRWGRREGEGGGEARGRLARRPDGEEGDRGGAYFTGLSGLSN